MPSTPPLCPSCGQPASQALAGPEHGWVCRNEACAEFAQALAEHEPAPEDPGPEAGGSELKAGAMEAAHPAGVLIVAHRTAATPALLEQVHRRAAAGACRFTLLVPRPLWDADTEEAEITLELAIPLLEEAAGRPVAGLTGEGDVFHAVSAVLGSGRYDEVIISTLPARVSHWLHIDLPARVQRLGFPVTVVTAKKRERPLAASS